MHINNLKLLKFLAWNLGCWAPRAMLMRPAQHGCCERC